MDMKVSAHAKSGDKHPKELFEMHISVKEDSVNGPENASETYS